MIWQVYRKNHNANTIEGFNVFSHGGFMADFVKLRSHRYDLPQFSLELRKIAQYYFWGRSEYEIILTDWPTHIKDNELRVGVKVSIFDQLWMNWEHFVKYCYEEGNV